MEVLEKLQNSDDATKASKKVSTRERLSVTIRILQSFFSTVHFFNLYNYVRYGVYYAKVLKNMEELYPGNKKILLISGISVQAQERYPTRIANDMRSEQTINRDTKTPSDITNFSGKQTPAYKWCMSRDSVSYIHVAFQGMIIKEII